VGAGLGIGRIGGQAMDAMARQPEKIGDLRSSMIIAAALVEGVAFFAAIIALLCVF
ncbi:MAG: ATP synthase F0 subunit C, partial [Prevotella denticola]